MRIDIYLSQLLYRFPCVTIPNFGAFLTENQSAKIDPSSHTFFPPKKKLTFLRQLKNNDGLLVNHVAQQENISFEQALELVADAVTDWNYHLQEFGFVTLRKIGTLNLQESRTIVFEPFEHLNYATTSFGLTSFISLTVARETYKKEVAALEETTPIAFTPEKRNTSWLKYAALFVVGIGAASFFGYQWYTQKVNTETLLVEKAVQEQVENKIQEATFFIENPLPYVTLNIASEKKSYHIVGGAFQEERNAQKAYQSMLSLGFNAKILEKNNYGLYPVVFGSYASMSEALSAKAKIQAEHNKEAWILIKD